MPTLVVDLCPALWRADALAGSVAVVIDALRATTTIAHALAAGCVGVRPCATIEEARAVARGLAPGRVLLAGERDGVPIAGFDAGNSPGEYTPDRCRDATLVMTTSNGTRAILHTAAADLVVLACFENLGAVCELLAAQGRPIVVVCAGDKGEVALEDVLVAGGIVARLGCDTDDAGQVALAAFERHRDDLIGALWASAGGVRLRSLGYDDDIRVAARLDTLKAVPWLDVRLIRL